MTAVCVGAGAVFHAFDLARELHNHGLLKTIYSGRPFRSLPVGGIPAERVRTAPWVGTPPAAARRLGCAALQRAMEPASHAAFDRWTSRNLALCDIYHCMSGFGSRTHATAKKRFGAIAVCDRGSTHILTQYRILDEEARGLGIQPRRIARRAIERELAEYDTCDAIFVPSTFAKDTFVSHGIPAEKVHRIPYGVDTVSFRPVPKQDDRFRVLFVGEVGYPKGISYLLRAVSGLPRNQLDVWLVGPMAPEAWQLMQPFRGSFTYLGRQPRRELAWYYSQCSVLVLPSLQEGLALVQAQAMACGLPVIATPNTGAEDLFTDGVEGHIVPMRDPDSIRRAILRLYENPGEHIEMSASALRRVSDLGGWNDYGRRVVTAYSQLLEDLGE